MLLGNFTSIDPSPHVNLVPTSPFLAFCWGAQSCTRVILLLMSAVSLRSTCDVIVLKSENLHPVPPPILEIY